MNEQALKDSYELFKQKGYTKSFDEYVNLINTNPDALNDSYTLFKEKGYGKSIEDFSTLVGVKKKDESVSIVQEDVTESITPTEQEEVISSDVSVPIQEARPQSIQEQEVSVVDESVPTDFAPEPQSIN